jgi:hypothetical protein
VSLTNIWDNAGTNGAITGGSITVNTSGVSVNVNTAGFAGTGFTASTQAGTNFSGTLGTNGLSLLHPNALTTAMASNASTNFAGIGETVGTIAGTDLAMTVDTAGVSIGYPKWITTYAAQSVQPVAASGSNGSFNFSTLQFVTGNGASFYTDATGIRLSYTVPSVPAQTNQTVGLYMSSNTYLTSSGTVDARSMTFRGVGVISVGQSAGEVVISAPAGGGGLTNIKISAGTSSANLSDITFSNSNGYSFGLNGSTITAVGPYVGYLEPRPMTNTAIFGPVAGSWYLADFVAPNSMSGGRINFLMQNTSTAQLFRDFTAASVVSSSTGGQQQGYTYSIAAALWSQGTGTNSTRLESMWSNSFSFGWTKFVSVSVTNVSQMNITVQHSLSYISEIGSNGAYTLNQYANSTVSAVANSSTASNFWDTGFSSGRNMVSNSVMYPIGFNSTITAGNYWLGFAWSSTRSNASTGTRVASALDFAQSSIVGISRLVLESAYRNWGSTVTTARSHIMPYGVYTGAANMAPPQFIALSSDLSSIASAWVPYFNFQNQGITK